MGKAFFDTNILVYTATSDAKKRQAADCLRRHRQPVSRKRAVNAQTRVAKVWRPRAIAFAMQPKRSARACVTARGNIALITDLPDGANY